MPPRDQALMVDAGVVAPDPPSGMETAIRRLDRVKKRLKLWEVEPWLLCSIVGTCLTPIDIQRAIRRHRLRFDADLREHELHSYIVERAGENGPVGRSLNKLLEEKFGRTVRLVAQEQDEARLEALWADPPPGHRRLPPDQPRHGPARRAPRQQPPPPRAPPCCGARPAPLAGGGGGVELTTDNNMEHFPIAWNRSL